MSYFRNIQNNGIWARGGTYTFEYFYKDISYEPAAGILGEKWNIIYGAPAGTVWYLFPYHYSIPTGVNDSVYDSGFTWGDDPLGGPSISPYYEVLESEDGGQWRKFYVYINDTLIDGNYSIVHAHIRWSDYLNGAPYDIFLIEEERHNIYIFGEAQIPPDPITPTVPEDRPDDYNFDYYWVPGSWDGDEYTPPHFEETPTVIVAAGGGRWSKQLVCVGQSKIYYESLV